MSAKPNWGVISVAVTIALTGITIDVTLKSEGGRVVGGILTGLGFGLLLVWYLRELASAERIRLTSEANEAAERLQSASSGILAQFEGGVRNLADTLEKFGAQNDARFLPNGFIGLQARCLALDDDPQVGHDRVRMAILGHLPSHMRINDLSIERGGKLYDNWEPPHLIDDYVSLLNRRSSALRRFIDSGGVVREIYDQVKLEQYVQHGYSFHDKVVDPRDEIIERLQALLYYIAKPNYFISIVSPDDDRPGPYFLLKQGVGLVVDLRTTESHKHFTRSLDGLYTVSPKALEAFEEKFSLTWRATLKDDARVFITGLITELQGSQTKRGAGPA
jgi:hypothetical protein